MSNNLTIDTLCNCGLYLSKFNKKDIIPISSTKVGLPYLIISESNVPIYSVIIKPTDRFKNIMHMEYVNYFVLNSLGEIKYLNHIAGGTKLVELHKINYLDKKIPNDINLISRKVFVGLLSSKYPLIVANEESELNRVNLSISLDKDSTVNVDISLIERNNEVTKLNRVLSITSIEPEDLIDANLLTSKEVIKQNQFLESLINSDVPHFAEPDFSKLVYKVVPDSLFRLGAYQPHSIVWYLTRTLGKSIVQNMYNNRDFKTVDIINLLADENRTLKDLYEDVQHEQRTRIGSKKAKPI